MAEGSLAEAPSAPPEAAHAVLHLLSASQPDIVRSVQKDELYQQQLVDDCQELARRVLGAYRALQSTEEVKLLAMLLYHGLTTGLGLPTLGEEYCNMLQGTGTGRAAGPARRTALVLLASLGPYLSGLAAARLEQQQQQQQQQQAEGPGSIGHSDSLGPQQASPTPTRRHAWHAVAVWSRRLSSACGVSAWQAMGRPLAAFGKRAHLALFYLAGAYFCLSHRLAGVRYVSISRPLQGRPSYRALGVLLVAQLAVMAALNIWTGLKAARDAGSPAALSSRNAMLLPEPRPEPPGEGSSSDEGEWAQIKQPKGGGAAVQPMVVMSGRPCPLCLNPRRHPTSTPCGHVFCWDCVARWCQEKPECPLCRSRVLLPQLVPIYHCAHF